MWPDLWRINPHIENPHLIYPGDNVRLVYVEGQPTLNLERGVAGRTYKVSPDGGVPGAINATDKLSPTVRSTPLETAIPAIPLDAVQGFLVENRVVSSHARSTCSPYVVQGESERLVIGSGDRLYVRGQLPGFDCLQLRTQRAALHRPRNQRRCSARKRRTSDSAGSTRKRTADISTMEVTSTRREIQIGDRVLPTEERKSRSRRFSRAPPSEDIEGLIISVFSGVTQVGQYDVVVLNRGEREGPRDRQRAWPSHKRGPVTRDRVANEMIRLPSERAGLADGVPGVRKALLRPGAADRTAACRYRRGAQPVRHLVAPSLQPCRR